MGTPILRYNAHLNTWQRFTTTVEVEYPEDDVDCRSKPPWWISQDPNMEGFLGIGTGRIAFVPVPSQKYPEILVATLRLQTFPDMSIIDWAEFVREIQEGIEATKKISFSRQQLKIVKEYLYIPNKGVGQ